MKRISDYEIVDHGIEHSDCFQGCGVAFTKFTDVATGIGSTLKEALMDAAEQLASNGYVIPKDLDAEIESASAVEASEKSHTDCGDDQCFSSDVYYYASIRIKEGSDDGSK